MQWFSREARMWRKALRHTLQYRGLDPVRSVYAPRVSEAAAYALRRSFSKARIAVSEETGNTRYDVMVFSEDAPSPEPLWIREHLSENGLMLVQQKHISGDSLSSIAAWEDGENHFSLFIKNAENTEGFVPKDEWPQADPLPIVPEFLHPAYVGTHPRGLYWRFWPATFELYHGNTEPYLEPLSEKMHAPIRVVTWQRLSRVDVPEKWKMFSVRPYRMVGFAPVTPHYELHWSENARRLRKQWLTECAKNAYSVESMPFDTFKNEYVKSPLPYFMKQDLVAEISRRLKTAQDISFWGAYRHADKKYVAGIAVLHAPDGTSSYYLGGFHAKGVEKNSGMTGLFDHWFSSALSRNERFVDFGNFWKPGDPSSWKGFSRFKAKFGPSYFFYQPMLYRFEFPKKR